MLADVLGEVVSAIVGDALVGLLAPDASKPVPPPAEGERNASLGILAACLAAIAAVVGGLAAFGLLRGVTDMPLWLFLGGSLVVAMLSGTMALRALEATGRRRGAATLGLWLSRATIVGGLLVALASLAGVVLR